MKEDRKEEIAKKTPTLDRCLKTMKQTTREEINHLVYLDPIVKNIPEREIKKLFNDLDPVYEDAWVMRGFVFPI
jgi:hypothetical protein